MIVWDYQTPSVEFFDSNSEKFPSLWYTFMEVYEWFECCKVASWRKEVDFVWWLAWVVPMQVMVSLKMTILTFNRISIQENLESKPDEPCTVFELQPETYSLSLEMQTLALHKAAIQIQSENFFEFESKNSWPSKHELFFICVKLICHDNSGTKTPSWLEYKWAKWTKPMLEHLNPRCQHILFFKTEYTLADVLYPK